MYVNSMQSEWDEEKQLSNLERRTNVSKNDLSRKSDTDWDRIDSMRDEDIDLSYTPEMDEEFFQNAIIRMPERKSSVTLRVDKEVLDWFKSQGKGYQSRMNAVLKAYMKAQSRRAS